VTHASADARTTGIVGWHTATVFGLDIDTDVSALSGCRLESIDLTEHQVQLRLDSLNGIRLSIESAFAITPGGGDRSLYERPRDAAQALADRLGVGVVDARVADPGTLTLRWDDGSVLEIFDSNAHCESYQIHLGERLIVV
jgi:hypothetical protein